MRAKTIGTLAFLALSLTTDANGQKEVNAGAAFERLNALKGTWSIGGGGSESRRVATFRKGAGNVLILDEGGQLTVFHLDNDKLALTHYCGSGNQPRMRLQAVDDRTMAFTMYDITNLSHPQAYHTIGLEIVFVSDGRVDLLYRGTRDGRDSIQKVQLTRTKS